MKSITQIIQKTLKPVCLPGNYAIIDYPNYLNPGDCAIWLGTRKFLHQIYGAPPVYTSTLRNFNAKQCCRLLDGGTVFLKGGGNFGSLYAKHNQRRLDIIRSLPELRLVLLPQSVAGLSEGASENWEKTKEIFIKHESLTVLARDEMSQSVFSSLLERPTQLCPDLAHAYVFDPSPPMEGINYLLRQDPEKTLVEGFEDRHGIKSWDWPDLLALKSWNKAGKFLTDLPQYHIRLYFQELVARAKVNAALQPLTETNTVVTDRLHGFIFAQALGRKVIIIDNSTGKVASYWKTWGSHFPNVILAENLSEAINLSQA